MRSYRRSSNGTFTCQPIGSRAALPLPELYQGSSRCFAEERWSSLEHRRSISTTTILWVPSDSHRLGCFWHGQAAYIRCKYLQDGCCMLQKRYVPRVEDRSFQRSSASTTSHAFVGPHQSSLLLCGTGATCSRLRIAQHTMWRLLGNLRSVVARYAHRWNAAGFSRSRAFAI